MAKIFKTDSQEKALKEIVDSLKIIDTINRLVKDENIQDCKVRVIGTVSEGNVNEVISMPFSIISSQIKDYRKRLIKDVLDKSKTYSIRLEDDENEILGVKTKKVIQEPAKPVVEEQAVEPAAVEAVLETENMGFSLDEQEDSETFF